MAAKGRVDARSLEGLTMAKKGKASVRKPFPPSQSRGARQRLRVGLKPIPRVRSAGGVTGPKK